MPLFQRFNSDRSSYRFMRYPPKKYKLQLLYPGRYMEPDFHWDGSNIPLEEPKCLEQTRENIRKDTELSRRNLEYVNKYLGGKDKIINHSAVAPEEIIENADSVGFDTNTFGLGEDLEGVDPKVIEPFSKIEDFHESQRSEITLEKVLLVLAILIIIIIIVYSLIRLI